MTTTRPDAKALSELKALAEIRARHERARFGDLSSFKMSKQCHEDRATLLSMLSEPPLPRSGGEAPSVTREDIMRVLVEWVARDCLLRDLVTSEDAEEFVTMMQDLLRSRSPGTGGADERVKFLSNVLTDAAKQFRHYENLHARKGTADGDEKARTNAVYALACEAAAAMTEAGHVPPQDSEAGR
jgi:hypothetical protein